jgi:hypothetical protein
MGRIQVLVWIKQLEDGREDITEERSSHLTKLRSN